MLASSEILEAGYEDGLEITEYLDNAEQKIFEVTQKTAASGPEPVKKILKGVFKSLDNRFKSEGGITGFPTGFTELDNRTAGLQPTELIILAARPAMGKTSFAISLAQQAATTGGWPCLVFSLEMSSMQLAERMLCSEASVDSSRLRRGMLERQDMSNLTYAAATLNKAPILIDDTPALSLREVRARARRFRQNPEFFPKDGSGKSCGLILIDYLQLMTRLAAGPTKASREQEISEISRWPEGAREGDPPARCSRCRSSTARLESAHRTSGRSCRDLRESGAIEQDADVILFIYRDVVYSKEACEDPDLAEVIIGKNRHGATGTVDTHFEGRFTRFSNRTSRRDEPGPQY